MTSAEESDEMKEEIVQVVTTVDSEIEADRMAAEAIEQRAAACAQVLGPISSHYRWKGELCRESEWMIVFKTIASLKNGLFMYILEHHPYETPEIVAFELTSVHEPYMKWMRRNLNTD